MPAGMQKFQFWFSLLRPVLSMISSPSELYIFQDSVEPFALLILVMSKREKEGWAHPTVTMVRVVQWTCSVAPSVAQTL